MPRAPLSRRAVLAATACAATPAGAAPVADPFSPHSLFADVETYAGFGTHHTGGAGDLATGRWIGARLRAAGFATEQLPVEAPFFESERSILEFGGTTLEVLPQHPVAPTGRAGLAAPLRLWRDSGDAVAGAIAVVVLPFARHSAVLTPAVRARLAGAARADAAAIVVVTDGPTGEAIALNSPVPSPIGTLPIVLIGPKAAAPLLAAATAGAEGRLVLIGRSGTRPAASTVARRPGRGRTVVVTTPLSGWTQCAGERGGGVAAFLALARWLPSAFPKLPLMFAGMVGHEYENAGSKLFLASVAPRPESVRLWVHLGSGFATRDWHERGGGRLSPLPSADPQRYLLAAPAFLPVLRQTMAGLPGFEAPYAATVEAAAGEAREVLAAGYERMIANFAGHRFHHVAGDGPETTSGALIAASAVGLRDAIARILRA